jgi:hypothetical protein
MRFLAVLAGYPLWKYQISVILGRGARYAGLAGVGLVLPIPGQWLVAASLVAFVFGLRSARRMNRPRADEAMSRPETAPEEA